MPDTNKPLKDAVVAWIKDHRKTLVEIGFGFFIGLTLGYYIFGSN